MDNTRAVPGMGLEGDPGHEAGQRPQHALKGGMAAPNIQAVMVTENTGSPHPGPTATDKDSPFARPELSGSGKTWLGTETVQGTTQS